LKALQDAELHRLEETTTREVALKKQKQEQEERRKKQLEEEVYFATCNLEDEGLILDRQLS
jgi:phosphotransacetylase